MSLCSNRGHTHGNRGGVWAALTWLETLPPCWTCGWKRGNGKHGPHWPTLLESWTLLLTSGMHGILGEDFWNGVCREGKSQLVLSPPLVGGCQLAPAGLPMVASVGLWVEAWGTDSKRCLKLDSDYRSAKPPVFMILLGGKRGSWHNLELSWQWVTGWFFLTVLEETSFEEKTCHYFQRPWR